MSFDKGTLKRPEILNSDSVSKRVVLKGDIDNDVAILIAERTVWPTDPEESNDIYSWYNCADVKLNLIHPATEKHVKKYSKQNISMITETAKAYKEITRPFMAQTREGTIGWVYNILDGKAEQDAVVYRDEEVVGNRHGFVLMKDMKWDGSTLSTLYLVVIANDRDIWSVRDLRKSDANWLESIIEKCTEAVEKKYGLAADKLRFYVHYQPTYYHFHIHVTHAEYAIPGSTTVGRAILLQDIIERLKIGPEDGYESATMTFQLSSEHGLYPLLKN
ncbi:hypothetical protein CANCADRAFT_58177 [Tortispora caseinolytica NRRL Y-17796]|uniref:HIT domain-containing protein n=1 Tax=Tortispora caseinolytica NRRL Y-17796 TaxID=767744 RepID=A0A1E4TBL1_9ASCO|nr:hypothetical protein CANCADRAFT_58177 [Tortispora caseinolytica NRRL Y-17796]